MATQLETVKISRGIDRTSIMTDEIIPALHNVPFYDLCTARLDEACEQAHILLNRGTRVEEVIDILRAGHVSYRQLRAFGPPIDSMTDAEIATVASKFEAEIAAVAS